MSRLARIILILLLVGGMFAVGFPLSANDGKPGFAGSHPLQSQRCFAIGDTTQFFSCLSTANARLDGFTLIRTVGTRLDLVAYPFGFLFFVFLGLFLVLALILV